MTMIEIRNVTKRYGTATVVDNVSMSVEKGEITVIVGTSGSGKSTLMRMINRLVPITEGEIFVGGQNVMDVPVTELRRKIGYAIQGHGLFPHRTVAQNIATVPQLLDWDSARIAKRGRGTARALQPRSGNLCRQISSPALRRPAAARRCRPGAGRRT